MFDLPLIDTIIIGDTHADLDTYHALLRREEALHGRKLPSIHLGDYGFGQLSPREADSAHRFHTTHRRHRFIRGNHDKPDEVNEMPGYLQDGSLSGSVLFLGGADGGFQGWDTQLSQRRMQAILAALSALETKPSVVISHDAPQEVAQALHNDQTGVRQRLSSSRTRSFLSEVQEAVHPELWLFGHWHFSWQGGFGNTHFRCLGFAECFTLPLPWIPQQSSCLGDDRDDRDNYMVTKVVGNRPV